MNGSSSSSASDYMSDISSNYSGECQASKEYDLFIKDVSSFIILICLCVVGTIGNAHVILVYWIQLEKSCLRIIIISLGIVDLAACSILIPHDIVDIRYNIRISSALRCEFFLYLDYFCTLSSVSMLALLALERYRLICKPMKRQPNTKETTAVCLATVLFCAMISIPCFVFYDNPGGKERHSGATNCVDDDTHQDRLQFQIYSAIIVTYTCVLLVICIYLYIQLAITLVKTRRNLVILRKSLPKLSISIPRPKQDNNLPVTGISVSTNYDETDDQIYSHIDAKRKEMKTRKKLFLSSLRSVLTFSVSTIISYSSWLLTILTISGTTFGLDIESYLGQAFSVIIHLFYVNNVVNPIVYFLLYPVFRQHCVELYSRLFRFVTVNRRRFISFSN